MHSETEVHARVANGAVVWELVEVADPVLPPLVPEDPCFYGEDFLTRDALAPTVKVKKAA